MKIEDGIKGADELIVNCLHRPNISTNIIEWVIPYVVIKREIKEEQQRVRMQFVTETMIGEDHDLRR